MTIGPLDHVVHFAGAFECFILVVVSVLFAVDDALTFMWMQHNTAP
jgi:hypothetical protein